MSIQRRSLLDHLEAHASREPAKVAFRFLADGETETDAWSYGELVSRSRSVAFWLAEHTKPGDRALLCYRAGLDFIAAFLGCLYAGVVAVPLYAPHPRRPDERLASVSRDCAPAVVLADGLTLETAAAGFDREPSLAGVRRLSTDGLPPAPFEVRRDAVDDLAFIQYTSGSTSDPKGVCVSHANILANEEMIRRGMGHDIDTNFVSWLPTHHDMGLLGDTLQPIYLGGSCVKIPPTAFIQHPRRWLAAVSRYRGTTTGGPNFAYALCVARTTPGERERFDLSSLRVTYCASEPIRARTLLDFADAFADSRFDPRTFFPAYGLAEATLMTSGGPAGRRLPLLDVCEASLEQHRLGPVGERGGRMLVGCGMAVDGSEVIAVDPLTLVECPPDVVGEIWVRGPHVSGGYWNKPEISEQTMRARTADGRGPYLRTGDFGFLRADEVYITGRLKDLIIVNGRNIYPQDVEHTSMTAHPAVEGGGAAAFSLGEPGDEGVGLVQELSRSAQSADEAEIKVAIRSAVMATHQVQLRAVMLVPFNGVPKTTSGKVRRSACRAMLETGQAV